MVLWWPTRPSRTNTQKRCPFHYKGLECKSRKSRDTWSSREVWPWSKKWSRAKANWILQENALVIANTLFQQHKRWLYTCTLPSGQYPNLYVGQEANSVWNKQFRIEKGVCQGCLLHPVCLTYTEHIMKNAGLDELQAGIKIGGRNINNLTHADDTTLMAESEEK